MLLSTLNQLLSSGTNFALGIYFARSLEPAEFGWYGLGFAITLFCCSVGNAVLLTPMVVNSPGKPPALMQVYAAAVLAASLFAAGLVIVAGLMVEIVAMPLRNGGPALIPNGFFATTAFACAMYFVREFGVRYAYVETRETWATAIHLTTAFIVAALLLASTTQTLKVDTATAALGVYALGQFGGAIVGLTLARLPVRRTPLSSVLASVKDNWATGRYGIVANIVGWLRTQAHAVLATALTGPVGLALVNAARLLFTPALLLTPAASQIALPRFARMAREELPRVLRYGVLLGGALLAVATAYSALLIALLDNVVHFAFGVKYSISTGLAVSWALFIGAHVVATSATLCLMAVKDFRSSAKASIVGLIALVLSVYPLYAATGAPGIVYSMVASELATLMMVMRALFRIRRLASA